MIYAFRCGIARDPQLRPFQLWRSLAAASKTSLRPHGLSKNRKPEHLTRFLPLVDRDWHAHTHTHAHKRFVLLAGERRSLWKRHLRPDYDPWLQLCLLQGRRFSVAFFGIQFWHPRRRVFEWSWLIVRLWLKMLDCPNDLMAVKRWPLLTLSLLWKYVKNHSHRYRTGFTTVTFLIAW